MTITREFVSLSPSELQKALGSMPAKHPDLARMIMSGQTTFTKGAVTYSLRGSASESRAMIEKSAVPAKLAKRDGEPDDEAEHHFMPPVPVAERETMFTAAMELIAGKQRERSNNSGKPIKIAMRLEGAAQVPVLVATRSMKPQNAQEERVQNQKDDDARKPVFTTPPFTARRLRGGDAA